MSVRKRDNKWIVDIDFEHASGARERIRKVSPVQTKRGAEQYEREIRQALLSSNTNERKEQDIPTLNEFATEFIEDYAEVNNKPSEVSSKLKNLNLHLLPLLGSKRLDEIDLRDLEKYKRKKLKEGYHPKTINNQLTTLGRMFTVAQEWGIINQILKMRKLAVPDPPFDFLNFKEADALIEATETEWKAMIVIALKCGLRQGELLGLRWDDINFERQILTVNRSLDRDGNIGTPKNGKTRIIPLNSDAIAVLQDHFHKKGIWVFCSKNGAPLRDNLCKSPIRRAYKKAGLRHISWHVLRHTFASHLVMRGAPLPTVQELMGHSTITMTMRYAHLSPDAKRDAVELLQSYGTMAAQENGKIAK